MNNKDEKHKFLVMHDYGTGGIWFYILARSENEIAEKYPLLQIVSDVPNSIKRDEEEGRYLETVDIDNQPDRFLQGMKSVSSPLKKLEFSFEELDELFLPLSDMLYTFVREHNLFLQKYYHGEAGWRLGFSHPKCGYASILVAPSKKSSFWKVETIWWKDVYAEFSRYIKKGHGELIMIDSEAIEAALERALEEVLSWDDGEWSEVVKGYEDTWSKYSLNEFKKIFFPDWPFPKKKK